MLKHHWPLPADCQICRNAWELPIPSELQGNFHWLTIANTELLFKSVRADLLNIQGNKQIFLTEKLFPNQNKHCTKFLIHIFVEQSKFLSD